MVMVEIDSSAILVEPIKNRTAEEMARAYLRLLSHVKQAGVKTIKHVIDNEISEVLREK